MALCSELKNNLFQNLLLDSDYQQVIVKNFALTKNFSLYTLPTLCGFHYQGFHLEESRLCEFLQVPKIHIIWATDVSPSMTVS